jgi:hypothetical protein
VILPNSLRDEIFTKSILSEPNRNETSGEFEEGKMVKRGPYISK